MSWKVDFDSVIRVCGKTDQLMIYGFSACRYHELWIPLEKAPGSPIKKTFSWANTGKEPGFGADTLTLEGRKINLLKKSTEPEKHSKQGICQTCKNGVTNLILENYKRKKEGKLLIPCIFVADCEDGIDPAPRGIPWKMTTKEPYETRQPHWSELRRMYKLCYDETIPTKIQAVAQETFIFIKLMKIGSSKYAFARIYAPWEVSGFDLLWTQRKQQSTSQPKPAQENWRSQLIAHTAAFDAQFAQQLIKTMQELETDIRLGKKNVQERLEQLKASFRAAHVTSPRFLRRLALLEHQLIYNKVIVNT